MGRSTGISWTRSTRNFWSGCTKVGPGCDGCYAEAFNRWTRGKNEATGQAVNWGPGAPRIPHLEGATKDLRKWNREALAEFERGEAWSPGPFVRLPFPALRPFWPVFLNSHSDMFDNEAPDAWRWQAFFVMEECKNLTFFLVTKRIGNVEKMVPAGWLVHGFPENVRLLITVVNQEEADRDVPKLLKLPCKNGVSYEPGIEPVDWCEALGIWWNQTEDRWERQSGGVEWIIVGGESDQPGHETRPFVLGWAKATVRQCRAAGVPVFVKQLGSRPTNREGVPHPLKDPAGADPAEWPEDLRVQEFPT